MSSQQNFNFTTKPSDFTFCDISRRKHQQEQDENGNNLGFSPPLWSKTIPSTCTCSSSSSSSATKSMVGGRKELMEMINDLPELSYELSLRDMVAEDDPHDVGMVVEDKVDRMIKLKGMKKDAKRGAISRSVSLDTGVFLVKMFVPGSFASKNRMVRRSSSTNGLKKSYVDVKQRKSWMFVENKSNLSSRSYKDDKCYNNKTRCEERTLKPGCWCVSRNQKWCIFF